MGDCGQLFVQVESTNESNNLPHHQGIRSTKTMGSNQTTVESIKRRRDFLKDLLITSEWTSREVTEIVHEIEALHNQLIEVEDDR